MKLGFKLRVSLAARVLASLGVLLSFSLAVALVVSAFGGLVGLTFVGYLARPLEMIAALPGVSSYTRIRPSLVAAGALLGLLAVYYGWQYVEPYVSEEWLLPPDGPVTWLLTIGVLGCLYLLVVEGAAALASTGGLLVILFGGVLLSFRWTVSRVRTEIRTLRDRLVEDSVPARERYPEIESTTRRLAMHADVPPPDVYVTEQDRPESFTVGNGASAVVVLSTELIDVLSTEELEAVLAHEVSHLANGDSRIMAAALSPVLVTDVWTIDDPGGPGDRLLNALLGAMKVYGQFGVAVLSRGREWAADAGAAALTGSPAALAAALARLDDDRGTPETDLRDWEKTVAAVDILPPSDRDVETGPFRTHPPTEDRIERLETLAARAE